MGTKPPNICPKCKRVKQGPCPVCTNGKRHNWKSDRERGTRQQRGYDNAWLMLRKRKLAEDPLCEYCLKKKPEVVRVAAQVHHIVPFHGLHDPLRLGWDNLASTCVRCHQRITKKQSEGQHMRFVVTGPPAGGKTTYVRSHAAHNALRWDWDLIHDSLTKDNRDRTADMIPAMVAMLESLVQAIRMEPLERDVWIIAGNPVRAKEIARVLDAKVINCNPGLDVCVERCETDYARRQRREADIVREWFTKHARPDDGNQVNEDK